MEESPPQGIGAVIAAADAEAARTEGGQPEHENDHFPMLGTPLVHRRSILPTEPLQSHVTFDGSILDPPSSAHSASLRGAAREMLGLATRRSRRSIVDIRRASTLGITEQSSFFENVNNDREENDDGEHSNDNDEMDGSLICESVHTGSYGSVSAKAHHGGSVTNNIHNLKEIDPESMALLGSSKHMLGQTSWNGKANGARPSPSSSPRPSSHDTVQYIIQQVSAVAVVSLLNMMVAIPFGASYFPVGWKATDGTEANGDHGEDDGVDGAFPLSGKVALGIRMFLFATAVGQLVGSFASKFTNPVYLQMVENIPFLHALAYIVIREQGYGMDALSTLFFIFGMSSVVVGITFYTLGKMQLGRIVYFFPSHVLVGCIGGIGAFIMTTAIEVTNNVSFTFDKAGIQGFADNFHLFAVVLFFEITLRILIVVTQDKDGRPRFQLLTPIFYCLITPMFYLGMIIVGMDMDTARSKGYFFPAMGETAEATADQAAGAAISDSILWTALSDEHMFDIFKIIDIRTVSWTAIYHCTGTIVALAAFSLIHVPINIPAFAISTDVDTDMNAELISHGYSNFASGIFGGLQNYMCYSNSVLYAKSGGEGRISSLGATFASVFLFVVGPAITSYLPRCMAGTLLLHIGIDLVLEGVYDSLGDYDNWEYAAIWVIALVMTFWGMTAALLAGVIAAMSTYAVQSMTFQNPIRQVMKATTLRSSAWNRCATSRRILRDHHTGRSRILIFQLNGHLFFGNVAQMTDTIKETLTEQKKTDEIPLIVIIDFTLVVGMDSSAAHAVHKLKKIIHRLFLVEVCIFVTGTDRGGFPCEYALTQALNMESGIAPPAPELDDGVDWNDIGGHQQHDQPQPQNHHSNSDANANDDVSTSGFGGRVRRGSISVAPDTASMLATRKLMRHCTGCVCESLDEALIFAEDVLVLRVDDNIENGGSVYGPKGSRQPPEDPISFSLSPDDELDLARWALSDLFVNIDKHHASVAVETMLSIFERKEYRKDEMLWEEDDSSSNALFLVTGTLLAYLKGTTTSEIVYRGNFVGELGLVNGTNRLASLRCLSEKAVVYVIDKAAWERLKRDNVKVAAMFNDIVILYMAHRVQHVSNRYFGAMMPI